MKQKSSATREVPDFKNSARADNANARDISQRITGGGGVVELPEEHSTDLEFGG